LKTLLNIHCCVEKCVENVDKALKIKAIFVLKRFLLIIQIVLCQKAVGNAFANVKNPPAALDKRYIFVV